MLIEIMVKWGDEDAGDGTINQIEIRDVINDMDRRSLWSELLREVPGVGVGRRCCRRDIDCGECPLGSTFPRYASGPFQADIKVLKLILAKKY